MPGLTATKAVIAEQGYSLSHGTITFDSSYPTGGEALAASLVGLDFVSKIFLQPRYSAALDKYKIEYDLANKKLVVVRIRPVTRHGGVAGAAAGNVTCTGIVAATDVLVKVQAICGGAIGTQTVLHDITSEFAICADNTIGNAAGSASVNGCLAIEYARPSDQEVANTTDLSGLVVDFIAYQFNDQIA